MSEEQLRPDPPPSDVETAVPSTRESSILQRNQGRRGAGTGLFVWAVALVLTSLLALAGGLLYTSKKHSATLPAKTAPVPKSTGLSIGAALAAGSENFAYRVEGDPDEYRYQLDGREKWRRLTDPTGVPIQVSDGDRVAFFASDAVCALSAPCTGPEGQGTAAGRSEVDPLDFPAPDAHFQALIARIGDRIFEVGRQSLYLVPPGTGAQSVRVMANIRISELASAKYGYRVRVRIQRAH